MSEQCHWPNKHGLKKDIGVYSLDFGRGCDLVHGRGWFCHAFYKDLHGGIGFGFDKKNKFTAVRLAIKDLL